MKTSYPIPSGFKWDFASMQYKHADGRTWDSDTNMFHDVDGRVLNQDNVTQDESVEQQIKRLGATAPRVTPADVQASIKSCYFFTAFDGVGNRGSIALPSDVEPLSLLTFCVLVLQNGFTVVGKSACASPTNYRAEVGQRVAREDAERQVWPLLGYLLRDQLAHSEQEG